MNLHVRELALLDLESRSLELAGKIRFLSTPPPLPILVLNIDAIRSDAIEAFMPKCMQIYQEQGFRDFVHVSTSPVKVGLGLGYISSLPLTYIHVVNISH